MAGLVDKVKSMMHHKGDDYVNKEAGPGEAKYVKGSLSDTTSAADSTAPAGVLHYNRDGTMSRAEPPARDMEIAEAAAGHGSGATELTESLPASEASEVLGSGSRDVYAAPATMEAPLATTADYDVSSTTPSSGVTAMTGVVGSEVTGSSSTAAGYSGSDVHVGQFGGEVLPGPAGITGAYREGTTGYEETLATVRQHGVVDEDMTTRLQ